MALHYPNGQAFKAATAKVNKSKKTTNKSEVIFGNRGMSLEDEINASNDYYRAVHRGVIHKKPTPIQIVKVDYPKRSAAVIKEAYFRQASTTDYNGVYRGTYLDFEAKETKNKSSFPFSNFHQHQIDHLAACLEQFGICFVIIKFSKQQRLFLLPAPYLITAWEKQANGGPKSMTLSEVESNGYEMSYGLQPLIPYLDIVDQLIDMQKEKLNGES